MIDWLEWTRALAASLAAWQAQEPALAVSIYAACLLGATVLGMPSPSLIEMAGGAVLGFWPSLLVSLPVAALGALAPFFASRRWLGPALVRRFPKAAAFVQDGVGRDGPLFLVTLRMMPGLPFAATNVFMAVTPIRARTFLLVNFFARIPLTCLFCHAGARIGQLHQINDIWAPETLLAFVGAALGPLGLRLLWRKLHRPAAASPEPSSLDRVS
jgi:uncharacterized membrane protein YdjX (TVP38/TMEM64 family)